MAFGHSLYAATRKVLSSGRTQIGRSPPGSPTRIVDSDVLPRIEVEAPTRRSRANRCESARDALRKWFGQGETASLP